jgi:hypothetical protein
VNWTGSDSEQLVDNKKGTQFHFGHLPGSPIPVLIRDLKEETEP